MGSGKKKIEIKRMENEQRRMVTFSKRRHGLFKKATHLHSLTGADIAILAFSPAGRPYTHGSPSFNTVIDRYFLKHSVVGESRDEEGCKVMNRRLTPWLDALQFEECDSLEELELLKRELEAIARKVFEKIGDSFVESLLV